MLIRDVEVIRLLVPLERQWQSASLIMNDRTVIVVKIHTSEGITGLGDAYHLHLPRPEVVPVLVETILKPLLVGEDPFAIQYLWEKMFTGIKHAGSAGMGAIAGVDMALWDILGKAHGASVCRLLGGGNGGRLEPYVGSQTFTWRELDDLDDLVAEAESYAAQGFKAFKVRGGRGLPDRREDIESIRVLREALGDEARLVVDVNHGYSLSNAQIMAREFERYGVFWMEDPVEYLAENHPEKFAELARTVAIPIAVGGNLFGRFRLRQLISAGGVDIVKPDASTSGGISEMIKMFNLASAWGIKCAPVTHEPLGMLATLHVMAAAPPKTVKGMYVEWDPGWPYGDFLTNPPRFQDGALVLPEGPGLGTDLNEDFVRQYRCEHF